MASVDELLRQVREKGYKLTKAERKIINYLLDLKGEQLVILKMCKELGISRQTGYSSVENILKEGILTASWQLNPYALGLKVIEIEANYPRKKLPKIMQRLAMHAAIASVVQTFDNTLRINIMVHQIDDYSEMERFMENIGIEIISKKILTNKLY